MPGTKQWIHSALFFVTALPFALSQELPLFTRPVESSTFTFNENGLATVECSVLGSPSLSISVLRISQTGPIPLNNSQVSVILLNETYLATLTIDSVDEHDSGFYAFKAENDLGSASRQFELLVNVAPVFTTKPENVVVLEGMSATFLCSVRGRPRPVITWFKVEQNNTFVKVNISESAQSVSMTETGEGVLTSVLTLGAVGSVDFGTYLCSAENGVGIVSSTVELTLKKTLPFLPLGSVSGVETMEVGHYDNGVSHVIHYPMGFSFGNRIHNQLYVSTNGHFSFSEPFYGNNAESFPGTTTVVSSSYLVAPFWADIDIRRSGNIFYEIHTLNTSPDLLSQVSNFVSNGSFSGTWMLVAQWDRVRSWPDGEVEELRSFYETVLIGNFTEENTFQGILITDGTESYAIFSYKCGEMSWTYNFGATIGFNAAGDYFENHPNTGSISAHDIACLNSPHSVWYNVVYKLSVSTSENTLPPPPTIEPAQASYLEFLDFGTSVLDRCRNCTSTPIPLGGEQGIPFGGYYHTTAYVETNGIISFGKPLGETSPALFPTEHVSSYNGYIVAPYWSIIDTRLNGSVLYKTYSSENSSEAQVISTVTDFIRAEGEEISDANWMLAATWDSVHPFPHGDSVEQDRQDPYLQSVNTFQALIISNGSSTYAVFTYNCDSMEWSGDAVIGFNAGSEIFENHALGGVAASNLIGCVHLPESKWNNVVYNLSPVEASGATPTPPSSVGTCAAAGHTECCNNTEVCRGFPGDCFCDKLCVALGDCCQDHSALCQADFGSNESYLMFSCNSYIGRVSLSGAEWEVVRVPPDTIQSVDILDIDYQREFVYWYDSTEVAIFRAFLNGSSVIRIVDTEKEGIVEDIAVDWVNNKVYWTDSIYKRIEVVDLDTFVRASIIDTGAHSAPRGIAVDPSTRYVYWSDWGDPAKIVRASMDGTSLSVIHSTMVNNPSGLTIDYHSQTVYWIDENVIEYSNVNGINRRRLQSGLQQPKAIAVDGSHVFWSDSDGADHVIRATHKIDGGNVVTIHTINRKIFGIVFVGKGQQLEDIVNACEDSRCEHLCLLSATDPRQYTCVCQDGYVLDNNGQNCSLIGTEAPPEEGSCAAAGFQVCCSGGHCMGFPPSCSCDADCHSRRSCCSDIASTCVPPTPCRDAGYDTCCTNGICVVESSFITCYCDESCHGTGDCCKDINQTCPIVTCPHLNVSNGQISYDPEGSLLLGTRATYSCNDGFELIDPNIRVCEQNGSSAIGVWGGRVSTCDLVTCPHLNVSNGQVSYDPEGSLLLGTRATYSCNDGFELIDPNIRVCEQNGSSAIGVWGGQVSTCDLVTCPHLNVSNGQVSYDPEGSLLLGTRATYSCNDGFELIDPNIRVCEQNGSSAIGVWGGQVSTCDLVTCPHLNVSNGQVSYDPEGSLLLGTRATYSCNDGFELIDPNIRVCEQNGSSAIGVWGGRVSTCDRTTEVPTIQPSSTQVTEERSDESTTGFPNLSSELLVPSGTASSPPMLGGANIFGIIFGVILIIVFALLVVMMAIWIFWCYNRRRSKSLYAMTGLAYNNPVAVVESKDEEKEKEMDKVPDLERNQKKLKLNGS